MDITAIIMVIAFLIVIVSILGKTKSITTILVIFGCFIVLFLVMSAVPMLQVEPVYSMIYGLFENLPQYLNDFVNYLKSLLGGFF
ncbi:MAG: hypothetical protein ACOWW1_09725 [archaeon]